MNRDLDPATADAVRRFLSLIPERYAVAGAIVYGSRARGAHRSDSDADVAVLLDGAHRGVIETTLELSDLAYDVLLETSINVTPLPVWLDEWQAPERHPNPALLRNIAMESVKV